MLSVSLDDVTENWSEMSRKGETFEPFLLFILILGGVGEGLVYDIITETRYDYYELFLKELEISNSRHLNLSHFANF